MRYDHGGAPQTSIDASVNVNPFGPPAALDDVFARARELAMRYPHIDAGPARDAWASRLGIARERVLVGNGASELISLVIRALEPPRVVLFEPCYSEYAAAAEAAGAAVVRHPLARDGATWSTPLAGFEPHPGDLVVVGQPNNPTGHLTSPEAIAAIAEQGARVLVDESFLPFLHDPDALSLASRGIQGVFVVTSLTKIFCVPGLRIGLLAGDAETLRRISELRDPWSVNGIALEAAAALADEDEYLARTRAWLSEERPHLAKLLCAIPGVSVCDGVAPFVLAELPEGVSATRLRDSLATRGLGVRDASTFAELGPRWVRVGVRSAPENERLAAAIAEYCAGSA